MPALLILPSLFSFIAAMAVLRGWVLTILWGWMVVPLFNVPHLPVPNAIGIFLMMSMFMTSLAEKKDDKPILEKIGTAIAAPFVLLFIGWLVTLFM